MAAAISVMSSLVMPVRSKAEKEAVKPPQESTAVLTNRGSNTPVARLFSP